MSQITQSLAGRSAFVELLSLTRGELAAANLAPPSLEDALFIGGYPALFDRKILPRHWFAAYAAAYIERDVRQLLKVQDLEAFQRFLRLCAGRSGQILNLSSLATDSGITHNTARAWLSVLEASFVLFLLHPHHENFNKRLIKSPKLYFYDTGLLCWLLGVQSADQLVSHPLRGAIFETYVVSELHKAFLNRGQPPQFYFWRDSNGNEVDLLIETGGGLMPLEIKSGRTINREYFAGLKHWLALAGKQGVHPTLIYGGAECQERDAIRVLGWEQLETVAESGIG